MNGGIVLKVGFRQIIIMNHDMEVIALKRKKGIKKGMKIYYNEEDRRAGTIQGWPKAVARIGALSLMVLLAVNLWMIYMVDPLSQNAYALVTMDINPSLELTLNDEGFIIDVKGFNAEGIKLLDINVVGLTMTEALNNLILEAEIQGYLVDEGAVLLTSTVVSGSSKGLDIGHLIETYMENQANKYTFVYYGANEVERQSAEEQGVSIGRLKLDDWLNQTSEKKESTLIKSIEALLPLETKTGVTEDTFVMYKSGKRVHEEKSNEGKSEAIEGKTKGKNANQGTTKQENQQNQQETRQQVYQEDEQPLKQQATKQENQDNSETPGNKGNHNGESQNNAGQNQNNAQTPPKVVTNSAVTIEISTPTEKIKGTEASKESKWTQETKGTKGQQGGKK